MIPCYLFLPDSEVGCWFLTQDIVVSNHSFAKIFVKFFTFCRFFRIDFGKTGLVALFCLCTYVNVVLNTNKPTRSMLNTTIYVQ